MAKKTGLYLLISFSIVFSSCLKLDNNLFNTTEKISEYRFDNYTGEQDFILDASYQLPPGKVTLFDLESMAPGEKQSTTIKALYIGDIAKITTDTVIVYCHGNKWHMDFYWQRAKLLAHTGGKNHYGVLMMDYRGYGLSEGKPSEAGLYADVNACLQWLKDRGLTSQRLIMYGFSLGSAPTCELSAHPRVLTPSKIILEAPFGSAAVMVQDASQLNLPASYFTDLKIDNAEEIKLCSQPLLWLHGLNDNFLNYTTHGKLVYDHHNGAFKEHAAVNGAYHGEVPLKFGFEPYLQKLEAFIKR